MACSIFNLCLAELGMARRQNTALEFENTGAMKDCGEAQ
jgi:hypothetical protein